MARALSAEQPPALKTFLLNIVPNLILKYILDYLQILLLLMVVVVMVVVVCVCVFMCVYTKLHVHTLTHVQIYIHPLHSCVPLFSRNNIPWSYFRKSNYTQSTDLTLPRAIHN